MLCMYIVKNPQSIIVTCKVEISSTELVILYIT